MKIKLSVLAFALLVLSAGPARADLHLVFNIVENVDVPAQEDGKIPATHTTRNHHDDVFLGDGYIDFQDDDNRILFDFTGRKIYFLTPKNKTYTISSLFSVVGFRTEELQNRVVLAGALDAGGVKDIPEGKAYAENELSVRLANSPGLPGPMITGSTLTYSYEGKPFFSRPSEGQKLSPEEAAEFARFLRYQIPLHPDILDAWQKAATLPSRFDIFQYGVTSTHIQFALLSVERKEHKFSPIADLVGFKEAADPLLSICAKAKALDSAQFTSSCNGLKSNAVAEAKAGQNLNAALLFMAYTLAAGQQMPPEFAEYSGNLTKDPDVLLLIKSISPHSEEEAKAAITALHSLEGKATTGKVFLNIFEADILDSLGQPDEAIKLFEAVLSDYPCLVGPWNDLGEVFYHRFEAVDAWECWDTGRRLLPNHPLFKDVLDLEAKLQAEHPEYFN